MAYTFTPTCPGTGPWYIDREDCIGDSLLYINANTGYLDCRISSLSANTNTQINNLSTIPYTRLNDGNQSGSAPIFGARAWVNFDGTGSIGANQTIRDQGNVSSVVKNNNGIYTINFILPMNNANYSVIGSGNQTGPSGGNITVSTYWTGTSTPVNKSVSAVQICTLDTDVPGFGTIDSRECSVVIFG